MSVLHRLSLDEGLGNPLDSVGGLDFSPEPGDSPQWCYGDVLGEDRNYLTIGYSHFPTYYGFLRNDVGLATTLTVFSIAFVGRHIVDSVQGNFFNIGGRQFLTRSNQIEIQGTGAIIPEASTERGKWAKYAIVCDGVNAYGYIDDMTTPVSTLTAFTLPSGLFRLLSYNGVAYGGSMELANLEIHDEALDQDGRIEWSSQFRERASQFSFYTGGKVNDFGGWYKWDEYDSAHASTSVLEIEELDGKNAIKCYSLQGGNCQMGVAKIIDRSFNQIWQETEVVIPTDFDVNFDQGQFFRLHSLHADTPTDTPLINVRLIQLVAGQNPLYLYNVACRTSAGDQTIPFPAQTEVTKGVPIRCKSLYDISNENLKVWIDDVLLIDESIAFDIHPDWTYHGLFYGVHPQNTGNYFHITDLYVGEVERSKFQVKKLVNSYMEA